MTRLLIVIAMLFCVSSQGCGNRSDWVTVNADRACSVVNSWLSGMSDDSYLRNFDYVACSNHFHSLLLLQMGENSDSSQNHYPLAARLTQGRIRKNDQWRYATPVSDLVAMPSNKYKLDVLMAGPLKSWENDQLYFCYDLGSNVVICVCELYRLNDHNHAGGYSALSPLMADIGVYKVDIRNIMDIERGFRSEGIGMDSYWEAVRCGRAKLFWETGTFRILSGKHVYNKEEFLNWANNANSLGVVKMDLKACTDSACVFITSRDAVRVANTMNNITETTQLNSTEAELQ